MTVSAKNLKEKDVYFVIDYRYKEKGEKMFAIYVGMDRDRYVFHIPTDLAQAFVREEELNTSFVIVSHIASFTSACKGANRILMLK